MSKPQPRPPEETPAGPAPWDPVYGDVEAYRRAVREGLASLDAGYYIDDEDVWAWVDSWDTDNELPPPEPKRRAPRQR